jgi:hypothetical protein
MSPGLLRITRRSRRISTARHVPVTRRLIAVAAAGGLAAFVMAAAGGPASAAPAPAASGGHASVTLDAASSGHTSTTIPVSAGACAALRHSLAVSHPGAAPMAHCEIGVALTAAPDVPTRTCGETGYWTTCYDKGTLCFGDKPVWGGPNSSFSCRGEAYVSVDGRWKYRTPHNNKVWILGKVSCPDAYFEGKVTETFCNYRNNGHPILTMEAEFDWSGTIGPINGGGNGYIAIYAHGDGKVTLYGAWNT